MDTGMKPIWYFVGLILLVMGSIVVVAGLVLLRHPEEVPTAMAELSPNLWWGAVMILCGTLFYWLNRKAKI